MKHLYPLVLAALVSACSSAPKPPPGPTLDELYRTEQQKIDAGALSYTIPVQSPFITDRICPNGRKGCDMNKLNAEMAAVYTLMDFQAYLNACKTMPPQCRDLKANELGLRLDHNKGVEMRRVNAHKQLDEIYQRELAAQTQRQQHREQMLMQNAQMQNQLYQQSMQQLQQSMQPAQQYKQTDLACVQRCQQSGSQYQFCQSKCSY